MVDKKVRELWGEFEDVPMNPETEEIEVSWHGFEAGTPRQDIWCWFEEEFDIGIGALMYAGVFDK